jgi:hypothetical protein
VPSAARAKPFGFEVSPDEYNPQRKPIGVFTDGHLTHSMGTYETRLPIVLPPARSGLVPDLALEYRSDGNRTIFGVGWDVPLDHVRRSLRKGTPRYLGPSTSPLDDDELEFRLGGLTGTLVYVYDSVAESNGFLLYRPKIEGAFAKFLYNPSSYLWLVQDRTGKSWVLGYPGSRDANGSHIFAWYVSQVVDQFENKIEYTYESLAGNLYPKTIKYDLKVTSTPTNYPWIEFSYDPAPTFAVSVSYRKGWRAELDSRLLTVLTVHAKNEAGVESTRTYSVQMQMTGSFANITSITPAGLPTAQFSYHQQVAGFPDSRDIAVPGGGLSTLWKGPEVRSPEVTNVKYTAPYCGHTTVSMLVDIDGDGKPDQLVYSNKTAFGFGPTYWWRPNVSSGSSWGFGAQQDVTINCALPKAALRYFQSNGMWHNELVQDVFDIDGDSKADIVYAAVDGRIMVCPGNGLARWLRRGTILDDFRHCAWLWSGEQHQRVDNQLGGRRGWFSGHQW